MSGTLAARAAVPGAIPFVLLALAACGGPGGAEMVALPVPPGWEEELVLGREERNRRFRLDPDTPLRPEDQATFQGLDFWPPDPAYRFVGPIHRYESPEPLTLITTTGKERPCERYGWLGFRVDGTGCRLQVYRLLDLDVQGPARFFLPFTDGTTGKQTYPAGRYVNLEETDGGSYVLDFNRADNPLCAYGLPERYACPVTPGENHLPVRIEAGERGYRRHGIDS